MPRGKKAIDLTGQRFGRLVVRERAPDLIYSGRPFTAWRCDCDCGTSSIATASGLSRGLTKSCGCLRRETGKFKTLDITGQRYGRLTVVKRVGSRNGKALWSCDCDCGTRGHETTQNQLKRGHAQSCGCYREEFLNLGIRKAMMPMFRPKAVKITYPVPENLHPNPMVNEVMRRRYQYRWERVEFEARQIERGTWKGPVHTPFIPRDDWGNRIEKLDLRALAREKNARTRVKPAPTPAPTPAPKFVPSRTLRVHAPIDERDLYGASSLADRIRILRCT